MLALLTGVILAFLFVLMARAGGPESERRLYAVGLLAAAIFYLVFGLVGGASARWLAVESLGVIIYGALAWAGLRWHPWLLALGWAAHVAWDLLLHLSGAGAEYTPPGYQWVCLSFDLVVAAAVLMSTRRDVADLGCMD